MPALIITNGDAAAQRMREAGVAAEMLCWRDILHEGPAPETESLEALSALRVEFLAGRGWSARETLASAFAARDATLRGHAAYDSVTVWLEHDLYDQLQLLQILDFFAGEAPREGLFLIQSGQHLSGQAPSALKRHVRLAEPISDDHLFIARMAWRAFRRAAPGEWAALLAFDTGLFPFLRPAILRHLEEFPAPLTGLSRTETAILTLIGQGYATPRALFAAFTEEEDAAFMGDWSFWHILDQLGSGYAPLVVGLNGATFSPALAGEELDAYLDAPLRITNLALNALAGRADAAQHRRIDRWMGGSHLTNANLWRWDAGSRRLSAP